MGGIYRSSRVGGLIKDETESEKRPLAGQDFPLVLHMLNVKGSG